jgi:membrane protease YdiL (CAAX protease family)
MAQTARALALRPHPAARRLTAGRVLLYDAALMLAWIGAWLLHNATGPNPQQEGLDTLSWTVAKLLVWLLPIPFLVRIWTGQRLAEYLSLGHICRGITTGLVFGLGFVILSLGKDAFTRSFGPPTPSPGLLNVLVIAPIFEEILFRGFILRSLQESGLRFWPANLLTAALFLAIHLPGWYFTSSPSLTQPAAMLGIVLVGLGAGLAKQRSGSLWGSILFHAVNNLYSAFLR